MSWKNRYLLKTCSEFYFEQGPALLFYNSGRDRGSKCIQGSSDRGERAKNQKSSGTQKRLESCIA